MSVPLKEIIDAVKGRRVYLIKKFMGYTYMGMPRVELNFLEVLDNGDLVQCNSLMKYINIKPDKKGKYIDRNSVDDYLAYYVPQIKQIAL